MSLSSLIVKREIATIRDVEEALSRQVIYGGDLVTNLSEIRPLDEAAVHEVLSEVYGLAPGPPGRLPAPRWCRCWNSLKRPTAAAFP